MRVRTRCFVGFAIVVALAVPTVVASGGVAHAAPDCTKPLVVGVRGSGETQADFAGFGQTVITAAQGFRQAYGANVTAVPVDYPAAPVSVLLQPNGIAQYFASINQGVSALLTTLAGAAVSCPSQPIVLFGYSQGAMVVHKELVALHTAWPALLSRVVGVGLIADPLRLGGQSYEIGSASAAKRGIALAFNAAPQTDLPTSVRSRARSLCNDGDPVCAYDLGNFHPSVHTAYKTNGQAYLAGALVARLARAVPGAPTNLHTSTQGACISSNQPGTNVALSWSGPTTGGPPSTYTVSGRLDVLGQPTVWFIAPPVPASQTSMPATCYPDSAIISFDVQASNAAGAGPFASIVACNPAVLFCPVTTG